VFSQCAGCGQGWGVAGGDRAGIERGAGTVCDASAIRALPEVVAFQELLRQVGVNPRREQPSVEKLLNFALKRGDLPAINSLVDAYNLVSIRSFCSLGHTIWISSRRQRRCGC